MFYGLRLQCSTTTNVIPPIDVPTYSVHVDANAHISFLDARLSKEVCCLARRDGIVLDKSLYP